jgi:hypothetical protein
VLDRTAAAHGAAISIKPASTPKERRAFIRAAACAYAGDPHYIAPLEFEVGQRLDPKLNPALKDAPHQLWIAYRDEAPVGRISAMVNPLHLARHKDEAAHFGFLDAVDDREVFSALLKTAEDWSRARGMRKLMGPYNFSVNEECGLLVRGFETPPYVMMPHGRPWFQTHVEAQGYQKAQDMHALSYVNRTDFISDKRKKFVERAMANPKVSIRTLDMKNFEGDIRTIVDIFNDAWSENWGFIPFTEDHLKRMAEELRPIVEKHNVVIASYNGEPAAFALVLPNINEAIRDFDGKLLPFNWVKLIWRLKIKGLSTARMPLMGVRKKFHGKPLGAAFAYKMIDMTNVANMARGLRNSEVSWILESNTDMLEMLLDMSCTIYKTYRIYEKTL